MFLSQFVIFILAVICTSIVLTFIIRYIWFFIVVKKCTNAKICTWKVAFSTAILMNAIDCGLMYEV